MSGRWPPYAVVSPDLGNPEHEVYRHSEHDANEVGRGCIWIYPFAPKMLFSKVLAIVECLRNEASKELRMQVEYFVWGTVRTDSAFGSLNYSTAYFPKNDGGPCWDCVLYASHVPCKGFVQTPSLQWFPKPYVVARFHECASNPDSIRQVLAVG